MVRLVTGFGQYVYVPVWMVRVLSIPDGWGPR